LLHKIPAQKGVNLKSWFLCLDKGEHYKAGRIVFRYSQDSYTFTCVKSYSDGGTVTYPGSGTSSAYNTYYALQTYYLW